MYVCQSTLIFLYTYLMSMFRMKILITLQRILLDFCCIIPVPLMCGFNELFYNKVQRFYSMELKKLEELE